MQIVNLVQKRNMRDSFTQTEKRIVKCQRCQGGSVVALHHDADAGTAE